MHHKKTVKKYYEKETWYHLIPLMFLIAIVPLIVYLKVKPLNGAMYYFWNGQKENLDFFSYYKSVWIIISALFTLLMLGIKIYQSGIKYIKYTHIYIPLAIYSIFVILSTIFSDYTEVAKWGFVDRYEGMYVLLSYMVFFFAAINLIQKEKHLKIMIGALFLGALIIGVIGFFQYMGYDIWKSNFGKKIMLPLQYQQYSDKLEFQFDKHEIYATLYHRDYVGSYMAMLFPLSFGLLVLLKNKIFKIFMIFFTILMAFNWIACNSRAGIVGGIIALVILLVMMNNYIISHWKYFLSGFLVVLLLFWVLNIMSKGVLLTRTRSLVDDAKKITQKQNINKNIAEESIPLQEIKVSEKSAEVITTTETLKFEICNGQILFKDENNSKLYITFEQKTGKINILSDKYKDYEIFYGRAEDKVVLKLTKGVIKFTFNVTENAITVIDNKGKPVDLNPVEKWGFEGKEKIGSSRGYIWSRSIPLLKNTKFIGYGPDTFAIYFPQNDIKGKLYAYDGDMWQVVDKPHNMYLQTAINTGCISLLAMLSIFTMYFISSVKLYIKGDFKTFAAKVGLSIFSSVFGYLGSVFFNDSIVSTAPVFWVLLGMGIATNFIIKSEKVNCSPSSVNIKSKKL